MDALNNAMNMHKGFTLLELIIIIVVLGILVSIGITNYTTSIERVRGEAYINNMRAILNAWRIYNLKEASDYAPSAWQPWNVRQINNNFNIFITESYFGWGTTTPGANLTSNLTNGNANARFLSVRGNRISNIARYLECNYYYQRNANQWNWAGTWPWRPANE